MNSISHWTLDQLASFLKLRQEFFLDPLGSNKERMMQATMLLQRALFDWYLSSPGSFKGMLQLVQEHSEEWRQLGSREQESLQGRRFTLRGASPELPAVESSVSENQSLRIFGSLHHAIGQEGSLERFLVQVDEYTNPSLRINHRYLGELLPHDNMISYLSSLTGTFLNENAIIGKVSPCVTHMEQAAIRWLAHLIGWQEGAVADGGRPGIPLKRLPTAAVRDGVSEVRELQEPTGTVVAGGTVANVSALLIARNAVLNYLLGWPDAVQTLGPLLAWTLVQKLYDYNRCVVIVSKGFHYSLKRAAQVAGFGPHDVIEAGGSDNPWILDDKGLERALLRISQCRRNNRVPLVMCVCAIAGKTETGYVDRLAGISEVLSRDQFLLPSIREVMTRVGGKEWKLMKDVLRECHERGEVQEATVQAMEESLKKYAFNEDWTNASDVPLARHNRVFLHVDAAHGGGFLTAPRLRREEFSGIETADTVTVDGHKMFYCYYPCGGLLIRRARWALTLTTDSSTYISEDTNRHAYPELHPDAGETLGQVLGSSRARLGRMDTSRRPELTHQPFNMYLEGSRGCQGIMQLYFNIATLGIDGYQSLLEWVYLLTRRTEEAVSLGTTTVRLVTEAVPEQKGLLGNAIHSTWSEPPKAASRVIPVMGGRLLRLSDGCCNQVLVSYIPARLAMRIASEGVDYWQTNGKPATGLPGTSRLWRALHYLWRVNEHLWNENLYANPAFSYYIGHTSLHPILPEAKADNDGVDARRLRLSNLLTQWNIWTRWDQTTRPNPFFQAVCEELEKPESQKSFPSEGPVAFYCHKIVVMHPYTDESVLGDLLGKIMLWGERSALAVDSVDRHFAHLVSLASEHDALRKKARSFEGDRGTEIR